MDERRQSVSVSPEADDYAARYDRMVAPGAGSWIIKVIAVLALIVVAWGLISYFV